MSTFSTNYNLQPADVIVVPKSAFNIVEHYVVYVGLDELGNETYIENIAGHGVRLISQNQFYSENPKFNRIKRFKGDIFQRQQAVNRAYSLLGKPYNLFNFNCEHFSNYVQDFAPTSRQVGGAIVLTGLALIFLFGSTK